MSDSEHHSSPATNWITFFMVCFCLTMAIGIWAIFTYNANEPVPVPGAGGGGHGYIDGDYVPNLNRHPVA